MWHKVFLQEAIRLSVGVLIAARDVTTIIFFGTMDIIWMREKFIKW